MVNEVPIQVYLTLSDAKSAIVYYQKAFDAEVLFSMPAKDSGKLMHATLSVFGSQIMLSDHFDGADTHSPKFLNGTSVTLHINLDKPETVDMAIKKAVAIGGDITMPAEYVFWGARYGRLRDPFGHIWSFAAPLESKQSFSPTINE